MMVLVAGAFDKFADASSAAHELRSSGFMDADVLVTSNAARSDKTPGTSRADEALRWPGTLEMLIRNLFDLNEEHHARRQQTEAIRRGGVVVSVPVHDAEEQSIARAVFGRHRAIELGNVAGGVPIY
jgi:hypothetical protein